MFATASLNAVVGQTALILGLVASLFGAMVLALAVRTGNRKVLRTAPRYAWAILVAAVVAFAAMERALITRDWDVAYVQKVGAVSTPALFNFTAGWSALEGSILLWVLVLAGYIAVAMRKYRRRLDDVLVGWAMVVMFAVSAFFFFLAFGPTDVFKAAGAPDFTRCCLGPNPLLQNHVLVLFHPPILYLGFVGFTVPFAFALAALITGRVGEGWLMETRRWALFAWGFLTIGIILGGWWSYEVLGWGGAWGWDPVENASFLPWLTGTAYIHSVMVQERRGMLRVWNISLLIATFALTILGTFLTRSGVIASVHAFSDGGVGPWLLGFFGVVTVVSLVLIAWRGDRLRSPGAIDSPISREGAFLANNVLFTVFAFVVLLGTVFPLVVEALQERKITVGAPFFDRLAVPIGLTLLFLMGVAPALPWRKASVELLRDRLFWPAWCGVGTLVIAVLAGADELSALIAFALGGFAAGAALRQLFLATRRQGWRGLVGRVNGGMIVHLGVILVAVGLAASNSFSSVSELQLTVGQPATYAGHTFELQELSAASDARSAAVVASVIVDGGQAYEPRLTRYLNFGQMVPTPSVKSSWTRDIYLTLEGTPVAGDTTARIKVAIKPLVVWLWTGGLLMAIGTVLAAFPGGRRRRPTDPVSAPAATVPRDPDDAPPADSGTPPPPADPDSTQPPPELVDA